MTEKKLDYTPMQLPVKRGTMLKSGQVAKLLHVPPRTARRYIEEGKIKAFQHPITMRWEVDLADVRQFLVLRGTLAPRQVQGDAWICQVSRSVECCDTPDLEVLHQCVRVLYDVRIARSAIFVESGSQSNERGSLG